MNRFPRRGFLKALGAGAGALVGARIPGSSLIGVARAATPEPTSVVCIFLGGGINAIFTGADAFTNTGFGVTASNVTDFGGVVIDKTLGDAIPQAIANRVASIGISGVNSGHEEAKLSLFRNNGKDGASPLMLADAIGGAGAMKAALIGGQSLPHGDRPAYLPAPVNGVSLQPITDMKATIDAIAGGKVAPNIADRAGMAKGIAAAQAMSKGVIARNTSSLASVDPGLASAVATLSQPVQPFSTAEFNTAYNLGGRTDITNFKARMAAAELMVRSGTNVVFVQAGNEFDWDMHGDTIQGSPALGGDQARNKMTKEIQPTLKTFLTRMVAGTLAERNVVVALFGDFHRRYPQLTTDDKTGVTSLTSDHQGNLAALLIGKTLKNATTGKTSDKVGFAPGKPGIIGLWQCLAAAAKVDKNPFGDNPHAVLA